MIQERNQSLVLSSRVITLHSKQQDEYRHRFAAPTLQSLQNSLTQLSASQPTQAVANNILKLLVTTFQAEIGLLCSFDDHDNINVIHHRTNTCRSLYPLLSFQTIHSECFPLSYCCQYHLDIIACPFLYRLKRICHSSYRYWKIQGFRSILFIPIWQASNIRGWIVLGSLSCFQKWLTMPTDILTNIQQVSESLVKRIQVKASIQAYQTKHQSVLPDDVKHCITPGSDPSVDMRWIATQDMTPVFFNQAWLKFIGLNLSKALEKAWSELIHPEDIHRFLHVLQQAILKQSPYSVTYRIMRFDGEYRWILQSAYPREVDGMHSYFYHGTCLDITDQICTHSDIAYYDSYLEQISLSTEDGLFTYDFERRLTYLSSQFMSMLNYRKSAQVSFLRIFKPYLTHHSLDHLAQTIKQHLEERTSFCVEYRFELENGQSKYFQIRGGFHYRTDGRPYQMIGSLRRSKKIEPSLSPQKNLAYTTLMSIGEPMITTNIRGHITHLNSHAETLTGYLLEEVQGRPVNDILHLINEYTGRSIILPILQDPNSRYRRPLDEEIILISKDQSHINVQISIAPILSENHRNFGMIMILHDVTQSKQVSKQLAWEAKHDPLTGLYNRREFENQLQHELLRVQSEEVKHILFFMDLDRFKLVNDSAGHLAGDDLLKKVSEILRNNVQTSDLIARIGGDEFCILLRNCTMAAAEQHAQRIKARIQQFRFNWNDTVFSIGISMGLVQLDSEHQNLNEVLNAADLACHMAKENGRDRIQIYQENDFKLVAQKDHRGWGVKIQQALEDNKFFLLYQNIYPTSEVNQISHAEILLRINDPHRGFVAPSAFLSAAERYDLMPKIDSWVVHTSLELVQRIQSEPEQDTKYPNQWMINLSGASLNNDDFIDFLIQQLAKYPDQAENIGFEITETVAIANLEQTRRLINACKEQGCQFALDDFGCGVSSFEYLKSLPVDYIKIDGQFISSMLGEQHVKAMVEAINHVGHVMNIKTIAEWVETTEQYEMLKNIGVDYIQGFGFHRPQMFPV